MTIPLILVGKMWAALVDWARTHLLSAPPLLPSPEDLTIPLCVASADEAITAVRGHRAKWLAQSAPVAVTPPGRRPRRGMRGITWAWDTRSRERKREARP
jgi:hypothetical protein